MHGKTLEDLKKGIPCPKCKENLSEIKAVEAGNIFKLGTKYTEAFGMTFADEAGQEKPIVMGCYGIGTTRLMGTIVEASHDEKGIIWPANLAPFAVHLMCLGKEQESKDAAEKLYEKLKAKNVEVLFDDRDESAGKKLNDADLIGIPVRVVVSRKTLEKGMIEFKKRNEKESKLISEKELFELL
jgi:prolyl-tRNA synthetase